MIPLQWNLQTNNLQALVVRHAIAWTLLLAGMFMAGRDQLSELAALQSHTPSYLVAVFGRSLNNLYQLLLLSGWLSVLPHFLLLAILDRKGVTVVAYAHFAAWAQTLFTSLGFIGTIVGVSQAVSGLEGAMRNNEPGVLIAGLSTAFDTTFLGLGAAVSLMLLRKLAEMRHS